jgi:hypothetical protein
MKARLLVVALSGAALALSACGGSDAPAKGPGAGAPPDPNDKRAVAFDCITNKKGYKAKLVGDKSIQVGGKDGPKIDFFVSGGEAEGKQFDGNAQGAEQIGASLMYVNKGSDSVLAQLEDCLDDQ